MATAAGFPPASDEENLPESESEEEDDSDESDSDYSEVETDCQSEQRKPCKFYNGGGCSKGNSCSYLHVCKYALKGNCRYGSKCKLKHNVGASAQPAARDEDEDTQAQPKLTDGRYYQWQLYHGRQWLDIDNDHVIEAQYSLPHTKSMKIYNTPYGAVSIDFKRMRVHGKNLKVRRLDDGRTVWIWYCTLKRKWKKYADKDSKGNPSPVKNSDIEKEYQRNPRGSYTFSIANENLEIKFKEMQQVGKAKRKVTRRPVYRQPQRGARASALPNHSPNAKPQWQFEGDHGAWHDYKRRSGSASECTVNSDDIEKTYQQNHSGSMSFRVNGRSYMLDFGVMKQTNLKTKKTRKTRRVMA